MLLALAGGVGAARLLRGMVDVMAAADITAVVNTGDDLVLNGLHISPDLDTVTYTLADAVDGDQGWGLAGETWAAMEALGRYQGGHTWFRLGDRDLATHLFRTQRLTEHATLSDVTAAVARGWGVDVRVLPMSDDRVETRVTIAGPVAGTSVEVGFQEWFVGRRHGVAVESVRFLGAGEARPAPGVLEAIASAEHVVICPSNPIVSIGPVLAVPGIEEAVADRRDAVVAVSPIVAGVAVKGPAGRMMIDLGHEASVVGVARLYAPLAGTLVIDEADSGLAGAVEAEGVRAVVAPSVMTGRAEAAALATAVLRATGP
ncbi:MAG: 2-phospho-L-lactate transferase [Acidimicrobiales bacterium]